MAAYVRVPLALLTPLSSESTLSVGPSNRPGIIGVIPARLGSAKRMFSRLGSEQMVTAQGHRTTVTLEEYLSVSRL